VLFDLFHGISMGVMAANHQEVAVQWGREEEHPCLVDGDEQDD
jgi:hypothetical protein